MQLGKKRLKLQHNMERSRWSSISTLINTYQYFNNMEEVDRYLNTHELPKLKQEVMKTRTNSAFAKMGVILLCHTHGAMIPASRQSYQHLGQLWTGNQNCKLTQIFSPHKFIFSSVSYSKVKLTQCVLCVHFWIRLKLCSKQLTQLKSDSQQVKTPEPISRGAIAVGETQRITMSHAPWQDYFKAIGCVNIQLY